MHNFIVLHSIFKGKYIAIHIKNRGRNITQPKYKNSNFFNNLVFTVKFWQPQVIFSFYDKIYNNYFFKVDIHE